VNRLVGVAQLRGKTHSSHGGRKAHLTFELKDLRPPEAARHLKSDLSDFNIVNADLGNREASIRKQTCPVRCGARRDFRLTVEMAQPVLIDDERAPAGRGPELAG
jgi:hypothetical protein